MVTDTCNGFRGAVVGSTGRHAWFGLTFGAMKGEKMTESTNSKFCNPGYVLDTECQCLWTKYLIDTNGNVHKRRVFRKATQYVKVCGYDKEQWASQATTQRWWLVMVPCSDWSTLVPQQSLTSESEEKHHTMPGMSYQEILFLFAVISHLTQGFYALCIHKLKVYRALIYI